MPKRNVAIIMIASMSLVVAIDLIMAMMLLSAHKSPALLLASAPATILGLVIAVLAWRGKLPNACKAPL